MTKIQQGLPRTLNSHFPSYNSYMHENPFCLADVILSDSIFHFAKKKKKKKVPWMQNKRDRFTRLICLQI